MYVFISSNERVLFSIKLLCSVSSVIGKKPLDVSVYFNFIYFSTTILQYEEMIGAPDELRIKFSCVFSAFENCSKGFYCQYKI
jgi:hypothetical protein